MAQTVVETNAILAAPKLAAMPDAGAVAQPVIRYATDAEVDAAMVKIFQKHDLLFAELAK